jgi:hypothetical protein
MKQLARAHCWWPKMDKDIVEITRHCPTCASIQPLPRPQFQSWQEPDQNWSRIHMDFAGPFMGSKWLLLIDAKSKFPIVVDMGADTTATNLSKALDNVIDWFGPPQSIVSDNGPPFNSFQMQNFYDRYNITHVTTPPYHPASNGIVERLVRSFKDSMLKQTNAGQTNKHTALRNFIRTYRWTPHTSTNAPPATLMFQHSIRTALEVMAPKDAATSSSSSYHTGQLVWTRTPRSDTHNQWKPGIVTNTLGSLVYDVTLANGVARKFQNNHLRPRHCSSGPSSDVESLPEDLLTTTITPKPMPEDTATPAPSTSPSPTTTRQSTPRTPRRYPHRVQRPPVRYTSR